MILRKITMIHHRDLPPPSWVYSLADYRQMFDLSDCDLERVILDYPASISSFNAEMREKGYQVTSGDSHYDLSLSAMKQFSQNTLDINKQHLKKYADILQNNNQLESIFTQWQRRTDLFLKDYEAGKAAGFYQKMDLPKLPFNDQAFDIALCSDYLFHNHVADQDNQTAVIEELCRVAKEVRVFPLQDEKGVIAANLGTVMLGAQQKGCGIEVRAVPYHELKGGNAMLRIWATQCIVEK